jgi:hypothetical protein
VAIGIYQKISGHWTLVERPYVHKNGVYTPVMETWVKSAGTWKKAQEYDVTPPNPPEVTLNIHEEFNVIKGQQTLTAQWLRVGVRLPGTANDPDLKMIRVLTEYPKDSGKAPTNPLGGDYNPNPDSSYPNEPWSDWRYNDFGVHKDSSVYVYKQYPRNATEGVKLTEGKKYYFTGWSLDANGNWSVSTPASITIPKKGTVQSNIMVKETRIQPNTSGSWTKDGYVSGPLEQQGSPRSQGHFFYGQQFTDSVGAQGPPTIRSAQIKLFREDDHGAANANIYLFWTAYANVGDLPAPGAQLVKNNTAFVGTLAKGQSGWFDLPNSFHDDMKNGIKGIGLDKQDPNKASAFTEDYSLMTSSAVNLRCGEVHIVWEEAL